MFSVLKKAKPGKELRELEEVKVMFPAKPSSAENSGGNSEERRIYFEKMYIHQVDINFSFASSPDMLADIGANR